MWRKVLNSIKTKPRSAHCAVVIVAAGQSRRMEGTDKITAELMGKSVICRSIEAFQALDIVDEIILVTRPDLVEELLDLRDANHYSKISAVVTGGASRVHSVMNGLDLVSRKGGLVAIHDGARPLVTEEVIRTVIQIAQTCHAAAPAIPVKDTVKAAKEGVVLDTPDRSTLFAVQTPQVFDFDLLRGALTNALTNNLPVTDDCSAVEAMGMRVCLTQGSEENIKITSPMDLILAEAILKRREAL